MKRQYKTVLTYFISYFLNAAISFFVVSVITHQLTAEEFGVINLYSAALVLIIPFLSCGTLNTISVEYFRKPEAEFKEFFGHALSIPIINAIVFTGLAFALSGMLVPVLKVDAHFIWLLPALTFLVFFNEVLLTIIRNRNRPGLFLLFSLMKTGVESAISLCFILLLHMTWDGRIAGMFAGVLVTGIFSIWLLRQWKFKVHFTGWSEKKAIILLSAPFIIERLSVFILSSSDRYFIDHYAGTDDVGLYGLGTQIATIVNLMILSLNNFFYPHIFERLKNEEKDKAASARSALMVYLGACFAIIIMMFAFIPIVFRFLIGQEFQGAAYYAYLLTFSFIPWAFYQVLLIVMIYMQFNKYIMNTALAGMAASLVLNFFLVQRLGPTGAAYTMIAVYTLMASLLFVRIFQKKRAVLPFFYKSASPNN